MYIKVITPSQKVFEGEIDQAKFPGSSGEFEVLNDHAPLVSTLEKGKMSLRTMDNQRKVFDIDGGVVEVLKNKITVLIESVDGEID